MSIIESKYLRSSSNVRADAAAVVLRISGFSDQFVSASMMRPKADATKRVVHGEAVVVAWDEDHDVRILDILDRLYLGGHLAIIKVIGERKGVLHAWILPGSDARHRAELKKILSIIMQVQEDPWGVEIHRTDGPDA